MTVYQGDLKSVGIPLGDFRPNPYQPKSRVAPDLLTRQRFGESILANGLQQLPVARRCPQTRKPQALYEIADGWLRLQGYQYLVDRGHREYETMPCIVKELTDQQMADYVMEANTVRNDLSPIDLAQFYQKYLAAFGVTQAELARRHGVSQGEIANTIRLLDLPEDVQARIITHEITESHGRCLLQLKDKAAMSEYAGEAVEHGWNVATLDAVVKTYLDTQKPKLPETSAKVRTCRVCGCTDDRACVTKEGPCYWVEADLCSACQDKEPEGPVASALRESGALVEPATRPEPPPAKPPVATSKPPVKSTTNTPSAAPSPASPARPGTPGVLPSRKLTLTEMADGVMAGVITAANPFPYMKKLPGTLEEICRDDTLGEFLDEARGWWAKDKKEAK